MANQTVQVFKFDREALDAIKRLARAIEHSNQLKIEQFRAEHSPPEPIKMPGDEEGLVHMPTEEELDDYIRKESGLDIDQKMREEAVAEGDDVDRLHP